MARDDTEEWAERLLQVEDLLGEAYGMLQELQSELKAAGRKKDWQALSEPLERLARYGRLFGEIRSTWSAPDD